MRLSMSIVVFVLPLTAEAGPIQVRKYNLGHELSLSLGSLPIDPFQKGWSAGLSYTVHFDQTFSWEVLSASAAYLVSTALHDNLVQNFGRRPEEFAAPRAMLTSGLVIAPLYGKMAFLDDAIIHHALFFGVHGGVAFGGRRTFVDTIADVRPALGLGIGYRLYLSGSVSLRLEARDFVSYRVSFGDTDPARFEQVLVASISLSLSTRGGDE